jgi:hypothetical protein
MKESDAEQKFREDGEVILGGVDVHVKFTRYHEVIPEQLPVFIR